MTDATITPTAGGASATTPLSTVATATGTAVYTRGATATATAHHPRLEAVAPIGVVPAAVNGTADASAIRARGRGTIVESHPAPKTERKASNHHYRAVAETTSFATATDTPQPVGVEDGTAFIPDRRVLIDGEEIDADNQLAISASETSFSVADITLFNLDAVTWSAINAGDQLTVKLGWAETGVETVFDGNVRLKRRRRRNGENAYVLRGRGRGADAITSRYVRSFTDMSPHRIVEHIVAEVPGLGRGYIGTGSEQLAGNYALTGAKELGDWLDALVTKAARQTGDRWVWYVENGDLYFHSARDTVTELVTFDMEKSVIRATPTGVVGADPTRQSHEIAMRCEPVVKRGLVATVANAPEMNVAEAYRVSNYLFESSTATGRHHTTAVFYPLHRDAATPEVIG